MSIEEPTGRFIVNVARIKRCLIECAILEDLEQMLEDIDESSEPVSDEVANRRSNIEYVIDWLRTA